MARFTAIVDVEAPAARTWAALVDWPAHGRWVPFTTVEVLTPTGAGVGARFVGRTAVGPVGFDDPMEIVEWTPPADGSPGRCRVVKQGRLILGSAWFEVRDLPGGRSQVAWTEDVELAPVRVTRPLRRLLEVGGRLAFTRSLRRMAAEIEAAGAAGARD